MTAVEEALKEIEARQAEFAPQLEGLYDYQRLNLAEATQAEVAAAIAVYEQRMVHLRNSKHEITELVKHGHPELPVREVSAEALADLQKNRQTIEAAFTRFASNAATAMKLKSGAPQSR
jgi:hypothetical protein